MYKLTYILNFIIGFLREYVDNKFEQQITLYLIYIETVSFCSNLL